MFQLNSKRKKLNKVAKTARFLSLFLSFFIFWFGIVSFIISIGTFALKGSGLILVAAIFLCGLGLFCLKKALTSLKEDSL